MTRGSSPLSILGGALGPKTVATATLSAAADFDGYLEMNPSKESVGEPVLRMVARFPQYEDLALPAAGSTAAMVEAMTQQALRPPAAPLAVAEESELPSAPPASMTQAAAAVDTSSEAQAAAAGQEVPKSTEPGPAVGPADVGLSGRPAPVVDSRLWSQYVPNTIVGLSGCSAGADSSLVTGTGGRAAPGYNVNTNSPFYIDEWVMYQLPPPYQILQHLARMQENKQMGLFPRGAFRNYNVWACGYQPPASHNDMKGGWHVNQL